MSYDAMAGYVWEIQVDAIQKVCPNEFETFMQTFENATEHADLDDFALTIENDGDPDFTEFENDENYDRVVKAYESLQKAFKDQTGVELCLGYVGTDESSQYNEVEGAVWHVVEPVQFKPGIAALGEGAVNQRFFCIFG